MMMQHMTCYKWVVYVTYYMYMNHIIWSYKGPYIMVHIISFLIQFQVCDEVAGNNLDFGVSIFGQSYVMQGKKSDFNMVQQKSWYLWPCNFIRLKFMTDFMFYAAYNFSSSRYFRKWRNWPLLEPRSWSMETNLLFR